MKADWRSLPRPDYGGGSLLNLMSSVIRSRGGTSPHAELRGLGAGELAKWKKVVVLLLDGLGEGQLAAALEKGGEGLDFWRRHARRVITSECPATTAAVVSTLACGGSPAEHGILGWHLHLPDLGMEGTILPYVTRTGTPMTEDAFDLAGYLRWPRHAASVPGRRELISWGRIPYSRTSMTQDWWTGRHAYWKLAGLVGHLRAFAKGRWRKPAWAYAYWPRYDSLCHEFGPEGPEPLAHLRELGKMLDAAERALKGTGTLLLVTADHGHMQTDVTVDLSQIPGFYDCLGGLPTGDARMTHCMVRPRKEKEFLRLLNEEPLRSTCAAARGEDVLASGLFGPGTPHPSLAARTGDYILFSLPRRALHYPSAVPGKGHEMKGTHGGLSREELEVPLVVVAP